MTTESKTGFATCAEVTHGTHTFRVDADGFPVDRCPRCGGTGRRDFARAGGRCFGCEGHGWIYPRGTAGRLAGEWKAIVRRESTMGTGTTLVVALTDRSPADWTVGRRDTSPATGDRITTPAGDWATVTDVEVTDEVLGAGSTIHTLLTWITFDTGERVRAGYTARRNIDHLAPVRDGPAARAVKAHLTTLARRTERAAAS